jgi:hypothetical protein
MYRGLKIMGYLEDSSISTQGSARGLRKRQDAATDRRPSKKKAKIHCIWCYTNISELLVNISMTSVSFTGIFYI